MIFHALIAISLLTGQATSGEILGLVQDLSGAVIPNALVSVQSLETNSVRKVATDDDGRFRVSPLSVGTYRIDVKKEGFAAYSQTPIVLRLNQAADLQIRLQLSGVTDAVSVIADAPLLNTNNGEVGFNFGRERMSELPLAPDRNVTAVAQSLPGVNPVQAGQNPNISGPFSVNGMRVRSNNFMIDGQDSNYILTGIAQQINNPDIIAEFRVITNQFAAEYGHNAGSIVNIITKSGTNEYHGSAFLFHNDNHLNARNNLQKAVGQPSPFRLQNQLGGTLGGALVKDRTFFFGSLQRWTDRRFGAGASVRGVPTEDGREVLKALAGDRPTVKLLLQHLPAAQAPVAGLFAPLRVGNQTVVVPLGTLSGSSKIVFDSWQWSARLDHHWSEKHSLGGRFLYDDVASSGDGQVTPPGLSTLTAARQQAASIFLDSALSTGLFQNLRLSYQRFITKETGLDPIGAQIPSIEVNELGLRGQASGPQRTAVGWATNVPRDVKSNTYQLQETIGIVSGGHSMKYGIDFRREETSRLTVAPFRGRLVYNTLQDLADDLAQTATITSPLPGGSPTLHYKDYSYFFFLQDEWRAHPRLTLTYGMRYESPGNPAGALRQMNTAIVKSAGGDSRFAFSPVPPRDTNNWAPRLGFNYRLPIGKDKTVLRGGYSRTYDHFIIGNVADALQQFPFAKLDVLAPRTPNSLAALRAAALSPVTGNINLLARTVVPADMQSAYAEQFALELQREFHSDWTLSIGYVGTKGTRLYETVDLNPIVPGTGQRIDPTRGIMTTRGCNCGSSIYHSLQTSIEKRLSNNLSMAAHYTWSTLIDEASDFLNPTPTGEIGIAQDAFNRRADRGRSAFDRPQRLVVNGILELPFYREQKGFVGKLLGGWRTSGFLTLQSGIPFTALDGADPGNRVGPIGTTVRANVNTDLDLAHMSLEQIYRAGGARLFSRVTAANPLGNIGRNTLRSDGTRNLDLGLIKNTRIRETQTLQFRAELYNATNTRNFGVPDGSISSPNFLNQWGTDGGNRRIVLAVRYVF